MPKHRQPGTIPPELCSFSNRSLRTGIVCHWLCQCRVQLLDRQTNALRSQWPPPHFCCSVHPAVRLLPTAAGNVFEVDSRYQQERTGSERLSSFDRISLDGTFARVIVERVQPQLVFTCREVLVADTEPDVGIAVLVEVGRGNRCHSLDRQGF